MEREGRAVRRDGRWRPAAGHDARRAARA
ncbi:hypothetical protein [Sorangium sp. So ce296]